MRNPVERALKCVRSSSCGVGATEGIGVHVREVLGQELVCSRPLWLRFERRLRRHFVCDDICPWIALSIVR